MDRYPMLTLLRNLEMNEKTLLVIANIIAVTEGVMNEVSGGVDLSDEVRRDGIGTGFGEATAVLLNNNLTVSGVGYVTR